VLEDLVIGALEQQAVTLDNWIWGETVGTAPFRPRFGKVFYGH
jgi:hypothetical protein